MNSQPDVFKQPPPPLPARAIKLPTTHETILPNGLTVIVVEDTRLPLVSYRLALRTGDAHDPADLPGLMDMLTGLLTEGTETRTSREIADEVARLGATLQAGANSDYTTVAASSLAVFCDQAFPSSLEGLLIEGAGIVVDDVASPQDRRARVPVRRRSRDSCGLWRDPP